MSSLARNRYQAVSRGLDHPAQRAVAELLVADEADAADTGNRAFVDLEHQVDPVLVELDDLGLDLGGIAAVAAVELEDAADGVLHPCPGVDHARPELDLALSTLLSSRLLPSKAMRLMIGFSTTLTTSTSPSRLDLDVVEQAGREQALDRRVDLLAGRRARPAGW